jgi:hypothetical protein
LTSPQKTRKSYEEIIDALIEALPVRRYVTIEELVRETGSSWETVYRWLRIIMKIQGMSKVESMKSPLGRGEVYSRERVEYGSRRA